MNIKSPKASVLVYSLIVLTLALVSALSLSVATVNNRQSSLSTNRSNQSFQVADSATEIVLKEVYKGSHTDLGDLAQTVADRRENCSGGVISGTYGGNTYSVTFLDADDNRLSCTSTTWRDDLNRIRSEGFAGGTSRVIETAVAAASSVRVAEFVIHQTNSTAIEAHWDSGNLAPTDTAATIITRDLYAGGEDQWGATCQIDNGWVAVGCGLWEPENPGGAGGFDADTWNENNGCQTDNEERSGTTRVLIRCMKVL